MWAICFTWKCGHSAFQVTVQSSLATQLVIETDVKPLNKGKIRAPFLLLPFSSQISSLLQKMYPTEAAKWVCINEPLQITRWWIYVHSWRTALILCQTPGSQTEGLQDGGDGKYEHLQGGSQHRAAKMLVHFFLPQQLVNQSTVFFMLVWQVTPHDLEVGFYTKAINRMFFQHRLIFCQALIISPVSYIFTVNTALDRVAVEYMAILIHVAFPGKFAAMCHS